MLFCKMFDRHVAKISVMGWEQAANVLATVKDGQYRYKGMEIPVDEKAKLKKDIRVLLFTAPRAFGTTASSTR